MKVNPPLAIRGSFARWKLRKSNVEIPVARQCAVSSARDHLMKIDVISESVQGLARFRRGPHLQRRAEVNLADPDSIVAQSRHRFGRLLEFDGEMAAIIIHPEQLVQTTIS